jgi:GH25 family lysozyme M1 (1,4-beta-N-acetylmuramidase)
MKLTDRRVYQARSLQDLAFRLAFDESENSRHRNAREHTGLLYTSAHPEAKRLAFQEFSAPNILRTFGTDTSHWDGDVNEQASKAAGVDFTIIKAMDGTVETRFFRANKARAHAAGLPEGPYAWLYPNGKISCVSQARALFNLLSSVGFGDLPATIDWEWTYFGGTPANPNMQDLTLWVDEWLRLGARRPLLYTAAGYANTFGTMPASLRDKFAGLWVANYGVANPAMPSGWTRWTLHQFTASAEAAKWAPNNAGKLELDLNYTFDEGTLATLVGNLPPSEPPEEGVTMKGTVLLGYNLNIRKSDSSEIIGSLRVNDVVYGQVTNNRIYYSKIYRANGTIETPGAMCSSAVSNGATPAVYWMRLTNETEPPVEPPAPVTKTTFTLQVQGYKEFNGELEKE